MAEHTTDKCAHEAGVVPDARRRALLMAAAATPVIATIPTGAALANSSAFHCVVTSKSESDAGIPAMSLDRTDQWVRVSAFRRRFVTLEDPADENTAILLDLWRYSSSDTNWYDADGKLYSNPNLNPPGALCDVGTQLCAVETSDTAVWVLRIYQPIPASGIDPTGVGNPEPQRIPAAPYAYPRYSTAFANPSGNPDRPSQVGNIGLAASCLCSVDPNSTPPGFCG